MRVGPRMQAVISYVRRNPGCSKLEAARNAVQKDPNNRDMGVIYAPVNRAIDAGLVDARRVGNRYILTVEDTDFDD